MKSRTESYRLYEITLVADRREFRTYNRDLTEKYLGQQVEFDRVVFEYEEGGKTTKYDGKVSEVHYRDSRNISELTFSWNDFVRFGMPERFDVRGVGNFAKAKRKRDREAWGRVKSALEDGK